MSAALPAPETHHVPDHTHHHHPSPVTAATSPPEASPESLAVLAPGLASAASNQDNGQAYLTDFTGGSLSTGEVAQNSNLEQPAGLETVVVLETQVDDLSPQAIGYLYDRLLAVGALDVFTQSITMKKSRPGHLINVIAYPEQADCCDRLLMAETTTLGVRRLTQTRHRLKRQIVSLDTPLGPVRMKLAWLPDQTAAPLKVHPEYEDCAALARHHNLPWRVVYQQAFAAWYQNHPVLPKGDNLDQLTVEEQV
jgi:hypothetical protein